MFGEMMLRDLALKVAWMLWGTFYSWGGDDPLGGFDCSGALCEILKSLGLLQRKERLTADGLWHRMGASISVQSAQVGDVVFWLDDSGAVPRATHVEMIVARIGAELFSIGASGGGPNVTNRAEAIAANAFMKVRPVLARGGHAVICDLLALVPPAAAAPV